MPEGFRKYRSLAGGLTGLVILALMLRVNLLLPSLVDPKTGTTVSLAAYHKAGLDLTVTLTWAWTALLIIAFMMLVGVALNQRPAGLIIDNRNRVSLSKFQAALWTVLVISTLITMAAARISAGADAPLAIDIPGELLAAMGIAVTSFVATPVLLSLKTSAAEPSAASLETAAAKSGRAESMITTAGSVVGWRTPACAQWLDMFRGEEASNAGSPDLSKVQQFLITLLLVSIYAGAVWQAFQEGDFLAPATSLPLLDNRFLWLMGISHAGYLAYKAAPHGAQSTPAADADGAVG